MDYHLQYLHILLADYNFVDRLSYITQLPIENYFNDYIVVLLLLLQCSKDTGGRGCGFQLMLAMAFLRSLWLAGLSRSFIDSILGRSCKRSIYLLMDRLMISLTG